MPTTRIELVTSNYKLPILPTKLNRHRFILYHILFILIQIVLFIIQINTTYKIFNYFIINYDL